MRPACGCSPTSTLAGRSTSRERSLRPRASSRQGWRCRRAPGPVGDKLRVLWRLSGSTLTVVVADNGGGLSDDESAVMLAALERRIGGTGAVVGVAAQS